MNIVMISHVFFCKQKTAYEMRIMEWSSDVCSSDLGPGGRRIAKSVLQIPQQDRIDDADGHGRRGEMYLRRWNTVDRIDPDRQRRQVERAADREIDIALEGDGAAGAELQRARAGGGDGIGADADMAQWRRGVGAEDAAERAVGIDRKSTRLNSSH